LDRCRILMWQKRGSDVGNHGSVGLPCFCHRRWNVYFCTRP
jgi:hypothetical protein